MVVKLADLMDNRDLSRLGREPTEKDLAWARKYENARRRLVEAFVGSSGERLPEQSRL